MGWDLGRLKDWDLGRLMGWDLGRLMGLDLGKLMGYDLSGSFQATECPQCRLRGLASNNAKL